MHGRKGEINKCCNVIKFISIFLCLRSFHTPTLPNSCLGLLAVAFLNLNYLCASDAS